VLFKRQLGMLMQITAVGDDGIAELRRTICKIHSDFLFLS
jgi:hypothetical protein